MKHVNKQLHENPGDFVPNDGHADWDPEDYGPDEAEFFHDPDFEHEAGDLAGQAVEEGIRDLTEEETQGFLDYVEPSVREHYVTQAADPNEDAAHPGEGPQQNRLEDAREIVARRSAGLSIQEQHLISQRMSLALSVFGHIEGRFDLPMDVLDAIMYGTDFVYINNIAILNDHHIPIDLPKKTKKKLEKAINYLLSISDETFWKNMSIATKKIGLTPLDGCIFMNVTIGIFGLKEPFIWESGNDRFHYIMELKKEIHESKQGEKLYNFFNKIISFKYKGKSIPRSVAATLARDAFCLLYTEI